MRHKLKLEKAKNKLNYKDLRQQNSINKQKNLQLIAVLRNNIDKLKKLQNSN